MMRILVERCIHRVRVPRGMRRIDRQEDSLVRCTSNKTTTTTRRLKDWFTQGSSSVSQWFHLGSNKRFDTATIDVMSKVAKAKAVLTTKSTITPPVSSMTLQSTTTRLFRHGTTVMTDTIAKVAQASSKSTVIQSWQERIQAHIGGAMSKTIAFQQRFRLLGQTVRSTRDQALRWFFVWSLAAIGVYGVATTLPKELIQYAMTKDTSVPATEGPNETIDKPIHDHATETCTQTITNYLRNAFVWWEK